MSKKTEISKRKLSRKYQLIPFSKLKVKKSKRTVGYDFTVEDYNTFSTADGIFLFDTMAIYVPLSKQAQQEAREKLLTIYTSSSLNSSNYRLTNEMLLGLHSATFEVSDNAPINIASVDELKRLHPSTRVRFPYKGVSVTSAGRFLFNMCLPSWYPFVDQFVDKKLVHQILSDILNKSASDFPRTFDCLMRFAFEYATRYPKTISIDLISNLPESIYKLKKKLMEEKNIENQYKIIEEMENILKEHLKKYVPELYAYIISGAAKGIVQLRQVMVAKGLFTDPKGNILPAVATAMFEGYKPEEYFNASSGARKGTINRVHTTSKGGYAFRKMVYVMGNTTLSRHLVNCETTRFFRIKLDKDLYKRLKGRYLQDSPGGRIYPITEDKIGQIISLRSPVYCKSFEICHICYGDLAKQVRTENVGILAAQECTSLSEKIMKAFHTGGAVTMTLFDMIKNLKESVSSSEELLVDKCFQQQDTFLICNYKTILEVDKTIFVYEKIKRVDSKIVLPVGYFKLTVPDYNLQCYATIEQITEILVDQVANLVEDDSKIVCEFNPGKIVNAPYVSQSPEKIAVMLDSYIGGKSPWSTPESLYMKLYRLLSQFGDWDSVHLEVIVGTILRWKKDPRYPARVKTPYEPIMISIKTLPGVISWPLGLAYENFNKAITMGLVFESGFKAGLEKVLFGESLVDQKGR